MDKAKFVELGCTDEVAGKIETAVKEYLKDFIPKTRFDEVNTAKKKLEDDIKTRDTQLEELKKSAGESDVLKSKIEELQNANAEAKKLHEKEIYTMKLDMGIEQALMKSKAKNVQMVKALLKMDSIKLDGETVIGLEDQIKSLKADPNTSFAFVAEGEPNANMRGNFTPETGGKNEGGSSKPKTYADFCKEFPQN